MDQSNHCARCVFFVPHGPRDDRPTYYGECRRRAPLPLLSTYTAYGLDEPPISRGYKSTEAVARWPKVHKSDFCGDFSAIVMGPNAGNNRHP
jgi:hypothetical protein